MTERDELASQIATQLEVDHQYVSHVEAWDSERIALVRSAGRAAGRLLGWKVRTFQSDPGKREDGRVVVFVVVVESTPEEAERMAERSHLLINEAFKDL